MKAFPLTVVMAVVLVSAMPAPGADDSKVKAATQQVETGARKIGKGQIGAGVEETAKGVGSTVVEGAKFSGEKIKEAASAAEPPAKTAWEKTRDGFASFGESVKNFFTRLFGD